MGFRRVISCQALVPHSPMAGPLHLTLAHIRGLILLCRLGGPLLWAPLGAQGLKLGPFHGFLVTMKSSEMA